MKKIILNQKSYLNMDEMIKLKKYLDKVKLSKYNLVVFPPILYLTMFKDSTYSIGTQNFYGYKSGSFTGELSLEQLKYIGITYSLVGHFERRKIINETYEMSKEKLFKSLNSKFKTILCVGENKKTLNPFRSIKKELNYYLKAIEENNFKNLSIVYEPNWAIGSGDVQCINKITKVINQIKLYINNKYNIEIEVYYGGSIDDENVGEILEVSDGIVLGKIGTEEESLKKIINKLK